MMHSQPWAKVSPVWLPPPHTCPEFDNKQSKKNRWCGGVCEMSFGRIAFLAALCGARALNPLEVVRRAWVALNMRSTCRHIMRPRTPAGAKQCLQLKLALREATQARARTCTCACAYVHG